MPRIKTTRTVKIALFLLRIYLIAMLLLILVKFVLDARRTTTRPPATSIQEKAARDSVVGTQCPTPAAIRNPTGLTIPAFLSEWG
jgi:hypothetical protein